MTTCRICSAPLVSLPDLPDAHPGCAPLDIERWERVTGGPRSYTGRSRPAVHEAGCRGCGGRIAVGSPVSLADVNGTRAWVHDACAGKGSPESRSPAPSPVPATPAPRAASGDYSASAGHIPAPRTTDETTAPRRAAA